MNRKLLFVFFVLFSAWATAQTLYFPPLVGKSWDTLSAANLGWCTDKTDSLYQYLESKNTKAFIVLQDGKIVLEKYFGNFGVDSFWYWASAGKTMTALLVGIAQEKGLLFIGDTSSKYLGKGWTSEPQNKEDLITIRHQLTMSSGLDDAGIDKDCTLDSCLVYKADAGMRWAYHNAPYTLLDQVIEQASGQSYQQFFNTEVRNKTGIMGIWLPSGPYNIILFSTPRSFARYGLLLLNKGRWAQTNILQDSSYFKQMTTSSQSLNPAYGYLTWLNGQEKFMAPGSQILFPGMLAPLAPPDMFAAMGKNGQLINVVPSKNLVMIRMGDAPGDNGEVPITFTNEIWYHLNKVICSGSSGLVNRRPSAPIWLEPNPGNESFKLAGMEKTIPVNMRVWNSQAELVFEGVEEQVSTNEWPVGIYFIEVLGEDLYKILRWVKQ